ncbi:patatin-like phospholipase family protein [Longirhabdus pacifica]|uniref:patatin-like phospholipase family protein n=1 Tax=Longirhabdus pacifica TaxID=2305227 RepID=UPI0010090352|nr:patatin family protein [Longirhabdus pacifica]
MHHHENAVAGVLQRSGLVLEGGGMKGVYTAGVLDFFMEEDWYFPHIFGVSAGASTAASYVSKQIGRNKRIMIDYVDHPEYIGPRNVIKEKSFIGLNLMFNKIPMEYDPFDFQVFHDAKQKLWMGTTDAITGEAHYITNEDCKENGWNILKVLQASCSLPFVSPAVHLGGRILFDGGVADPIPITPALQQNLDKIVVILTKDVDYQIKPFKRKSLLKMRYPKYEGLKKAMLNRANVYNQSLATIKKLEEQNKAFVIRPSKKVEVSRLDKDKQKLEDLYDLGYEDAKQQAVALKQWIQQSDNCVNKHSKDCIST